MKVTKFEGTPEEFQVVAHLFSDTPAPDKSLPSQGNGIAEGEGNKQKKEAIRLMLTRRDIHSGQKAVYKALADGELSYAELLEKLNKTPEQMRGIMGALGRRVANTPEIVKAGLPGHVGAVVHYRKADDGWHLSFTSEAKEVLQEEGLI